MILAPPGAAGKSRVDGRRPPPFIHEHTTPVTIPRRAARGGYNVRTVGRPWPDFVFLCRWQGCHDDDPRDLACGKLNLVKGRVCAPLGRINKRSVPIKKYSSRVLTYSHIRWLRRRRSHLSPTQLERYVELGLAESCGSAGEPLACSALAHCWNVQLT